MNGVGVSSIFFPGAAGGSALGSLMLRFTALTTLAWIGSGWELIALVVLSGKSG